MNIQFNLAIIQLNTIFQHRFSEYQNRFRGSINYATSLFKEETIQLMIQNYVNLLEQISKIETSSKLKRIDCICQKEYDQIMNWNNANYKEMSSNEKTLHQIFEEIVEINPDKTAIVFYEIKLTYQTTE